MLETGVNVNKYLDNSSFNKPSLFIPSTPFRIEIGMKNVSASSIMLHSAVCSSEEDRFNLL
jgi:hypothetical protein